MYTASTVLAQLVGVLTSVKLTGVLFELFFSKRDYVFRGTRAIVCINVNTFISGN